MRSAPFNARAVNTEPMNGMGRYAAISTFAASWNVLDRSPVAATYAASYDIRNPVAGTAAASWDMYSQVFQTYPVLWDETGGVRAYFPVSWAIPFRATPTSVVSAHSGHGALTRHTDTSSIGA